MIPCPVVVMYDGSQPGMVIRTYTDAGAGAATVERIEYSSIVMATDACPLHFVVVEE